MVGQWSENGCRYIATTECTRSIAELPARTISIYTGCDDMLLGLSGRFKLSRVLLAWVVLQMTGVGLAIVMAGGYWGKTRGRK